MLLTTAATDLGGIASYSLERATAVDGPYTVISSAATFPYVDSGLTASTTYYYRANATDPSSNTGSYSAIVSQTTLAESVGDAYTATDSIYNAKYSTALAAQIATSTIYVRKTGNDSTGNGSSGNPYLTIGRGIQAMSAGSHLIVGDGVYDGPSNWISTKQQTIPSGTDATHMTVFRAENPFGARIRITANPSAYEDGPIQIASAKSYLWCDGFILEDTHTSAASDDNAGFLADFASATNSRGTRLLMKKKSCDQYGGWLQFGNSNVFEDCHGFGSYRYAYSGGTGGGSSPSGNTVLRRCVAYGPFGQALEPSSLYSFYGSNSGSYALCKDVLFANCYAIDSAYLPKPSGENPEDLKWGDWYHAKSVRNVEHVGCGSINGGSEYGAFRTDNFGGSSDLLATFADCFVVNNTNGKSSAAFSKASNGLLTISNYTIYNSPGGGVPASGSTNTNGLTSGIVSPVQRSGSNGAEQKYAVGAFLSAYGASGYKTPQTDMPLWPFPYESAIATLWSETITKVANDVPSGATASVNPASGTSLAGQQMTFTRRVWESAGTATPDFRTVYAAPAVGNSAMVVQRLAVTATPTSTPAFDTTTGFLFATIGRGAVTDFNTAVVTDNAGNTLALTGSTHSYSPQYANSGTGCFFKANATGRTGCIVTSTKPTADDEVTLIALNILNATQIEASSWVYRQTGPTNTATDITVTRPSVLVAVWAGNDGQGENNPQPSSGWTRQQYTNFTNSNHVQMAIATRVVSAGTYGITWTPAISQGAQLYLFGIN